MTTHFPPLSRRLVALVFPLMILGIAAATTPTFVRAGLASWPAFIFGPPMVLALVIAFEYWNVSIGFSRDKVHYRSVGYGLEATRSQVSVQDDGGKLVLRISEAEPKFHTWLGPMHHALTALMPQRARYAEGMMASIPLWYFTAAPSDAVTQDFQRFLQADAEGDGSPS